MSSSASVAVLPGFLALIWPLISLYLFSRSFSRDWKPGRPVGLVSANNLSLRWLLKLLMCCPNSELKRYEYASILSLNPSSRCKRRKAIEYRNNWQAWPVEILVWQWYLIRPASVLGKPLLVGWCHFGLGGGERDSEALPRATFTYS